MYARKREQSASRRETAESLRVSAAAIREEIATQERALAAQAQAVNERREADEAGKLETQARELDLEQARIDRAAELRRQADGADAAAVEFDAQVKQTNAEMLEATIRAARFKTQIAGDVVHRREAIEQRLAKAGEAADSDEILAAEHDFSLLPALEARLQEQADTATAHAAELNRQAADLESKADEARASATTLRRWSGTDPLRRTAPPLPEWEQKAWERERFAPELLLAARDVALRAVCAMPDPGDLDDAATVFAREVETHRAARTRALHAQDIAQLEEVARLVEYVRDVAAAEADRRLHAPLGMQFTAPIASAERKELDAAVTLYRSRLGRQLQRCDDLATSAAFEIVNSRYFDKFAADVAEAAAAATEEINQERAALDAPIEAHNHRAALDQQAP